MTTSPCGRAVDGVAVTGCAAPSAGAPVMLLAATGPRLHGQQPQDEEKRGHSGAARTSPCMDTV